MVTKNLEKIGLGKDDARNNLAISRPVPMGYGKGVRT